MNSGNPPLVVDVVSHDGTRATVMLGGELDFASAPVAEAALTLLLHDGVTEIVLDVSALDFVGVSGLRVLDDLAREVGQRSGSVVLRHPSPLLLRLLDLAGVRERFSVEDERRSCDGHPPQPGQHEPRVSGRSCEADASG